MANTTEKLTFVIEAEDRAKETLRSVEANVSSMGDKVRSNLASIAGLSATAGVAFAGMLSVSKSAIDAFAGAEAQTAVSTKLLENSFKSLSGSQLTNLKAQLGTTGDAFGALKGVMDQAGQSAVELGFDDETASNSFTKFFVATKDKEQALTMLNGAMDLSRAKNIDLEQTSKLLLMANAGNTKELKLMGVELEDGVKGMGAMKIIMDANKGSAEDFAKTTAGAMEIAKVKADNLNESLGGALAPAFKAIQEAIAPVIQKISEFVTEHPKLTGAIVAITLGATGLIAVVGTLTVAMGALSMVSLPIVLIIGAIVLAVGALVAVFLYWDEITKFLSETFTAVWAGIKEMFFSAFQYIKDTLNSIFTSIKDLLEQVKNAFVFIWEGIKQATIMYFDFIKNYFSIWGLATKLLTAENMKAIYAVIVEVWTKVKTFFVDVWEGVKGVFKGAIDYIGGLIDSFMAKVQSMTSAIASVASTIGGGISSAVSSVSSVFKRATGGSVSPNTPYIVGENGAETFVPNTYGSILNSSQLAGAGTGGITINMTGNQFLDENSALKMGDELMKILKLNIKI